MKSKSQKGAPVIVCEDSNKLSFLAESTTTTLCPSRSANKEQHQHSGCGCGH